MFVVFKKSDDEYYSLKRISKFLSQEIAHIFGENILNNVDCIVRNVPDSDNPMIGYQEPPIISLSVEKVSYWCQVIFQLSHEMCHFALRQRKKEKHFTLSWFEEIVCEAFSIYCLQYAANHWGECELSEINSKYSISINKYLSNALKKNVSERFSEIKTVAELRVYEKYRVAESDRSSHFNETKKVFEKMCNNPMEIVELCNYQTYVQAPENLKIDFKKWNHDTKNQIVKLFGEMVHF